MELLVLAALEGLRLQALWGLGLSPSDLELSSLGFVGCSESLVPFHADAVRGFRGGGAVMPMMRGGLLAVERPF